MAFTDTSIAVRHTPRTPNRAAGIANQITLVFTLLAAKIKARLAAIESGHTLRKLSDHQLDDIGLTRADVERRFPGPLFRDPGDSLHRFNDMVGK